MKKSLILTAVATFSICTVFSQCSEIPTNRVLLVGDSWASFLNIDQTITRALRNSGHSDKKYTSSFTIAENGADTWDFVEGGGKQAEIQSLIDANPDIDIVHLSIGGNDLLGSWNVSWSQEQTDSLEQEVAGRLQEIIEFLQNTRPGMRVFWAGYTYPNFGEVISTTPFGPENHPFFDTWDGMGQPDFTHINKVLNDYSDSLAIRAAADPQLDFVPAQAILQYNYGQEQPLGVAPGGTYPQFEAPLPYGHPDYPSPKASMRNQIVFTDAFHLSPEAYLEMLSYQTQKFYQKFFMDDLYLLSENGGRSGSVSSAGSVTQAIRMGEEGGNEVAAVLSFSTQDMADTTLSGASIFLRRASISGTNPITGNDLLIRMISGNFGATADVEADDFTAEATVTGIPCMFGSNNDGHWIRLDLTAEMLANVSNDNATQFIVSVPGFTGGTVTFSDASDPELAPVLNLVYGPNPPLSVREHMAQKELPVYPVPTTGPLTIGVGSSSLESVEVINILGETVMQPAVHDRSIDISALPIGPYILRITTGEGVNMKRIIKR